MKPRPRSLAANSTRVLTQCGWCYIFTTSHEGELFEVFAIIGKTGGCGSAQIEAITRAITLNLRNGVDPAEVIHQLKGIQCPNGTIEAKSCADAIATVLQEQVELLGKVI